jgi:hypothetical protein
MDTSDQKGNELMRTHYCAALLIALACLITPATASAQLVNTVVVRSAPDRVTGPGAEIQRTNQYVAAGMLFWVGELVNNTGGTMRLATIKATFRDGDFVVAEAETLALVGVLPTGQKSPFIGFLLHPPVSYDTVLYEVHWYWTDETVNYAPLDNLNGRFDGIGFFVLTGTVEATGPLTAVTVALYADDGRVAGADIITVETPEVGQSYPFTLLLAGYDEDATITSYWVVAY